LASYHFAVKAVSRSTGRSAPAAAAYRSGERLADERTGLVHDYTRRSGVEATVIVTPVGAAWAQDRAALWNAAEAAEKRKDAKVAREYEVALPAELDAAGRLGLVKRFGQSLADRYGVVADIAIHQPGKEGDQRNWHAHILTTTRAANENGLGAKTRVLDVAQSAAGEVEALRALWAEQTNEALERAGESVRIDHRSHERRGLEAAPTERVATATYVMERRGQGHGAEARAEIKTALAAVQAAEAEIIDLEAERERRAEQERAREAELQAFLAERERQRQIERDRREAISPARAAQLEPFIEAMRRDALVKLDRQEREATTRSSEMGRDFGYAIAGRDEAVREVERREAWQRKRQEQLEAAQKAVEEQRRASPIRAWLHDRGVWTLDSLERAERQLGEVEREHGHAAYLLDRAKDDLARQISPESERQWREAIKAQREQEAERVAAIKAAREALNSPEWRRDAQRQANHMLNVREIVSAGQVEHSWGKTRFSHPLDLSAQEIERRDAVLAEQPEVTKAVMEAVAKERDQGMEMDL